MRRAGILVSQSGISMAITASSSLDNMYLVQNLHNLAIKTGFVRDVKVGTSILNAYAKLGELNSASLFFESMPVINGFSRTTMIKAYAGNGRLDEACKIYENASEKTLSTHTAMITGFAQNGRILEAREVFNGILKPDVVSWTAMVAGYAQNSMLEEARALFDKMLDKNSVTWATMVSGYAQHEKWEQALMVFSELHREGILPRHWTYTTAINACANSGRLELGKQIHSLSIKTGCQFNPFVSNGLITMYAKCKHIEDASWQFSSITIKDKLQWSSLVSEFSQNHALEEARHVFDKMGIHDIISWTSMISVYIQAGHSCEAIELFTTMLDEGLKPNPYTITSILCICADLGVIELGKQIHGMAIRLWLDNDVYVSSAMMSMYFKWDERHEEREETYWRLGELYEHLRSCDYMLETEFVMDGLEEEDFIDERLPWLLATTIDLAGGAIQCGQRL
ncbi:hypothetical protein AMTR_s00155p00015900 [Amborella trichopoda]|uniref:Pentacotripeptide-repeat region of PRORP domain-containing protein n=1 Tax=Amborella trichopoda TaxID=13333 RepID=W1PIV0_AMBTC|nr:hypothetical protein AMTR_s00155p00015900 [Amborella trichopoda]